MKIYLIINTDELRISQILPLDENEIRKNWLAVEIPEETLNKARLCNWIKNNMPGLLAGITKQGVEASIQLVVYQKEIMTSQQLLELARKLKFSQGENPNLR